MKYRQIKYGGSVTGDAEEQAIIRSIKKSRKTHNWQQAEEGALFEQELTKTLNVKHAVLTTSGSAAGLLALSALELPKGSQVIIPAVTFPTIFNIILQCGLVPVVVDAKVGTYNLDPKELEAAITPETRAIIAVHVLGNPCDMPAIMKIAKKHKLYVIEDNCDGLGSTLGGKPVGSFGHISFTSFHAAHIVSMGVGGGVFTNDPKLAQNVRMYRDWGRQANTSKPANYPGIPKDQNPRFIYEKIGYNFQILDLQAAMGRVQLKQLKKIKAARKRNFDYLYKHLSKYDQLVMPKGNPKADICWFAFPLSTAATDRGTLTAFLEKHGIETRSLFAGNITRHPAYADTQYAISGDLNHSNWILEHSFWVSCHPRLSKEDLKYIVSVFDKYYA